MAAKRLKTTLFCAVYRVKQLVQMNFEECVRSTDQDVFFCRIFLSGLQTAASALTAMFKELFQAIQNAQFSLTTYSQVHDRIWVLFPGLTESDQYVPDSESSLRTAGSACWLMKVVELCSSPTCCFNCLISTWNIAKHQVHQVLAVLRLTALNWCCQI